MDHIKINRNERARKLQNKKNNRLYCYTPPKYNSRTQVYKTVQRWQKKYGYDFECPEYQLDRAMRQKRQEFRDKATKYCGTEFFKKKQTRFDKMKIKEQLQFRLEEMPIKKKLRKVDRIIVNILKRQGFVALLNCK